MFWAGCELTSPKVSVPDRSVNWSASRQKSNQHAWESLSLVRTTVIVGYSTLLGALRRRRKLNSAESGCYARKGRTNQALWTFSAAPASVSVSAAGRTSPGLWRRQVKCMQRQNLLMGSLRLNAANGLCHPVCVPAVRDGPGTWDDSAVLRPADGRSNSQKKEAPAPVAQRLMIRELRVSNCSSGFEFSLDHFQESSCFFHQSNYTVSFSQQGTQLCLK